jgi:uncharacterized membrane protein YbhN (UPF0104 family)
MSNDIPTTGEAGVTTLVRGIVDDAQELFRQQIALFKSEFRENMRKAKEASLSLAIGVCVAFFGVMLLLFAIVHLLSWALELPLWASFAIVGGLVLLIGLTLMYAGKKRFESFHALPEESAQALVENVQWITNRK